MTITTTTTNNNRFFTGTKSWLPVFCAQEMG